MSQVADTLPKLLIQRAQHRGGRDPAIREKEFGIWQTYNWAEYLDNVRAFALGLSRLGFRRGDKLAIIGDNRPQLYWALVAAEAMGAIPVPLYQDAIAAEMQYVIDHSDSKVVVAEDQEQVDKILEMKDKLPGVEHVIFDDPKGMRHYAFPFLRSFAQVEELGREQDKARPALFAEEVAKGGGDDVAIINYTSGTTGFPKGVILTHQNLITTAENFLKVDPVGEADELMAYLPMAWTGDTFFSVVVSFVTGATVNCPEDTATVRHDFREIGPTVTFAPPRIWENFLSQAQLKLEDADWLKRRLAHGLLPQAMRVAALRMEGKPVPWSLRLALGLGEWLVFAPLRDQLGLRRLRWATTGGAAMGPEVLQFFRGIGVNLKQIYGLTESSAPATVQRNGAVKVDSVGPPMPGVEVSISQAGEVLLRCPGLFKGYYKDEEATNQTLRDGWLATGDAGFVDPDGHLVIIDRAKDVSRLLDGSVFAPQYIENKLKFSVYIKEAVATGRERPYVAAMININAEVVGNWAERRGIPYSGYVDLSQNPQVYELIYREVQRVNRTLTPALRIRRVVLLHKELDPDDAEITRTRKVRRRFVSEKYKTIIDALYDSAATEVRVKAVVTYEDGRTSETERSLKLLDVAEA